MTVGMATYPAISLHDELHKLVQERFWVLLQIWSYLEYKKVKLDGICTGDKQLHYLFMS